jgi:hypothetical protein
MIARMERTLYLTVQHHSSQVGDLAACWVPRLLVVLHGIAVRLDQALPEQLATIRFGACMVVVEDDSGGGAMATRWHHVETDTIAQVIAALAALGLPGAPDVHGVDDTGDYVQSTVVSGAVDGVPLHLRVQQMQSGMRGRDVGAFTALMRCVLAVAGLDPVDRRWHGLVDTTLA